VKLLLVEDDEKIAATVKRGLEAEGFSVELAGDGDEGLWRATEGSYDLLVLDIMLPGRDGYRLCAELPSGRAPRDAETAAEGKPSPRPGAVYQLVPGRRNPAEPG
jgi:DNA-binding response OmpR family regulator